MKIALVHDYIKEFGGAERVLRVLADIYPQAPIYTSFRVAGGTCDMAFSDRRIYESKWAWLIKRGNLYSPLRFLAPLIWRSIDLTDYDLVITSCSSFFARGFKTGNNTRVVAYCHTPPRFLYGFETSVNLQKYWIVRVYAVVVNHFLRLFDQWSARRVDKWIVNSKNVANRVQKFYREESEVIYPPVEVEALIKRSEGVKKENFFLIVSRLVGAKGLIESARAAKKLGFKLKVVGESVGFSQIKNELEKFDEVELLGRVSDEDLEELYSRAKGFIALAKDEDFGITPVESQAAGTPVIAFNGGGFRETVIDGKTGIFIDSTDERAIGEAIKKLDKVKWKREDLTRQARRFSKEQFMIKIKRSIETFMKGYEDK